MSIIKNCLIVNLQVGAWTGYRLDKGTTAKLTSEANAAPDAARVSKHVVPKEAMAGIAKAQTALRQHFYSQTLPWKDNGDRLLTRKSYLPFIERFNELKAEVEREVDLFIDEGFLVSKQTAAFRMGDLFDERDYPEPETLRDKFYINLDVDGVPDAFDVRLNKDAEVLQARVGKAVEGLWKKLAEPLKHFSDKMNSDQIFRDSTVNNLREIAALIPGLNFMGDENLSVIQREIERELVAYDAKDLRKSPDTRTKIGAKAQEILDRMNGYMGIGSGDDEDEF